MSKILVILSGGADSATLAYHLARAGHDLAALSFDYGQRHKRELKAAMMIAGSLNISHKVVWLPDLGALLKGSALTDKAVAVPHGHYAEESMRQTVVPNRNTIMLSIAWGAACADGCDGVALGVHAGDHFIYPDCRPEYVLALENAFLLGTVGHRKENMRLFAPFSDMDKVAIVKRGLELGVPFQDTWTCYEGGDVACGKCGSCRERLEAFEKVGAVDPLPYAAAA
jgi:7-cyano-7-deazaguanine synthase